jgi:hypothetical protein
MIIIPDLFINNDTDGAWSYVKYSSRLAMIELMRHTFLDGTIALRKHFKLIKKGCFNKLYTIIKISLFKLNISISYFDVHNIASLVDFHISRQWKDTALSERPREQISSAASVTLSIRHFVLPLSSLSSFSKLTIKQIK